MLKVMEEKPKAAAPFVCRLMLVARCASGCRGDKWRHFRFSAFLSVTPLPIYCTVQYILYNPHAPDCSIKTVYHDYVAFTHVVYVLLVTRATGLNAI